MTDFSNRRAGLLFGSFIADALSLGVHWIYDANELSQKFGYVTGFHAPGADSYHPHKQAGEQGHVGDQALCLNDFLANKGAWSASAFMQSWVAMWPEYKDYFDHATKTTLANFEKSGDPLTAASDSNELAGPARIAPLLAFLADKEESKVVQAAVEQTCLTHRSDSTIEATTFLATAAYRIMHGEALTEALRSTAPEWALKSAEAVMHLESIEAIDQLGLSCPIPKALPGVIYLALKYGDDLSKAFSENAMAGGDNCARALALGMLLGAAHGIDAIPAEWQEQLSAQSQLLRLLQS